MHRQNICESYFLGHDAIKQFQKFLLTLLINIKEYNHETAYEKNNKFVFSLKFINPFGRLVRDYLSRNANIKCISFHTESHSGPSCNASINF